MNQVPSVETAKVLKVGDRELLLKLAMAEQVIRSMVRDMDLIDRDGLPQVPDNLATFAMVNTIQEVLHALSEAHDAALRQR